MFYSFHSDSVGMVINEENNASVTYQWKLKDRKFLREIEANVTSSAFQRQNNLLVVGYATGVFALYEMPGCIRCASNRYI